MDLCLRSFSIATMALFVGAQILETNDSMSHKQVTLIAGSLESAYSLNWGAREIWGKGGGETLALLW